MNTDSYTFHGFCPICEKITFFHFPNDWFRDYLLCSTCENGSVPRERALALMLNMLQPNWRSMSIHESSPNDSGISRKLRKECDHYIATYFHPNIPLGQYVGVFMNENLESLTFPDDTFDIFISLDVFEHLFSPQKAFKEIWRTLKPGGFFISTWPIRNYLVEPITFRASINADGSVSHTCDPEIHGNPVDSGGSLVTVDYGYDIHKRIAELEKFDVSITRFSDRYHGILGDYTDVVCCKKYVE